MDIKSLFIFIFCTFLLSACGSGGNNDNSPSLLMMRLGGTGTDYGYATAADSSGNIIFTGSVYGNADLNRDGSVSSGLPETATSVYDSDDIFIAKFNSAGVYQWSKRLGGMNSDYGFSVTTDSDNNIIVSGYVFGDIDLNGDGSISSGLPETATATYGSYDIFIVKFDSAGIYQWSKRLGGTGSDLGYGITTDSAGNVVVTGLINGNADLNGDGSVSVGLPETVTVFYDGEDIFIAKFDSAGIYQWSKRLGRTGDDKGVGITTDSDNSIIITGSIYGNADMNGDGSISSGLPETQTAAYSFQDIFISKFDTDGVYQWAKRLGGSGSGDEYGRSVTTDQNKNVIVTGWVYGSADLDGDGLINLVDLPETVNATYDDWDIFIAKFDSDGLNQWSKRLGGTGSDRAFGITTDSNGNVIVTGNVYGNADMNGDGSISSGLPETITAVYDSQDIFISKFNSTGVYQWSKRLGGIGADYGYGITIQSGINILLIGYANENADLNGDGSISAGLPETAGAVYGSGDIFCTRFNSNGIPE